MKNKYYKRSRISESKFREIIKYFEADLTVEMISDFTWISRVNMNKLLMKLRCKIAEVCEGDSLLSGNIELDESYFGPSRIRGKRGCGVGHKTIVFELLLKSGKVFT